MARPELVLAGLLVALTAGVLILWPVQAPVSALLRVLGAWLAAFLLWFGYLLVEMWFFNRKQNLKKMNESAPKAD